MTNFKLIALKPLKGVSAYVLKNLKVGQYYFFDAAYQPRINGDGVTKSERSNGVPSDEFFFNPKNSSSGSLKFINFQAIVGKNGEGKSSLIDFVIRLLNNYHALKLPTKFNQLLFIEQVYGELYYEINGHILRLICGVDAKGKEFTSIDQWYEPHGAEEGFYSNFGNVETPFFTLGINYSIYAWNALHYRQERTIDNSRFRLNEFPLSPSGSWLNRLFHKNDGYFTPLALHPYREQGRINVNNEEYLTRQRLLSLCIHPDLNYNALSDEQSFTHFVINQKEVDYIERAISSAGFDENDIRSLRELLTFNHRLTDDRSFGKKNVLELAEFFLELPQRYYEILRLVQASFKNNTGFNHSDPVSQADEFVKLLDVTKKEYSIIKKFFLKIRRFSLLSSEILLYPIYLMEIEKIWEEIVLQYDHQRRTSTEFVQSIEYLTYKSLTITSSYPKYKEKLKFDKYNLLILDPFALHDEIKEICRGYIHELLNDRSHITLKIFQTLNFICNYNDAGFYDQYQNLFGTDRIQGEVLKIPIKGYSIVISNLIGSLQPNINSYLSKERLYLEYLPPPIFATDIRIEDKSGAESNFNLLSSGERQLISVTSSIVYHLKNIDSIELDELEHEDLLSYEYVNIMLDEIELYFHPEYQRQFISKLIFLIKNVNFSRVKGINFMLVTHSPFILSDIPKNNVLFLEKGKPIATMVENTFGANIHTLLQHGFFLNHSTIGQFAKETINELFRILHEEDNFDDFPDLEQNILLVSEPFLKAQLLKLYNQKKNIAIENQDINVSELLNRIKVLEEKLNDPNR